MGFERLGGTSCSNISLVLSKPLFYYVVALMATILKPHSNFRASHRAIDLEAHNGETQRRQSVCHSPTTRPLSLFHHHSCCLSRSGILTPCQHGSLVFKAGLCLARLSCAVDKLEINSHQTAFRVQTLGRLTMYQT